MDKLVKVTMRLRASNLKKVRSLKKLTKTKLHPRGSGDEVVRRAIDQYEPVLTDK